MLHIFHVLDMRALAVIPARYASTRFPGKPLVDLGGATMLERVVRAAQAAQSITDVLVATDDIRIESECERIGVGCVMTSADLPSGTDRVAAAAAVLGSSYDVILNVQGDEPLLQPSLLNELVQGLVESRADVCTPVTPLTLADDLDNPTICKVTRRSDGTAMYFSRSVIPHVRGIQGEQRLEAVRFGSTSVCMHIRRRRWRVLSRCLHTHTSLPRAWSNCDCSPTALATCV